MFSPFLPRCFHGNVCNQGNIVEQGIFNVEVWPLKNKNACKLQAFLLHVKFLDRY
jgi:hypothetical protein